MLLGRLCAAVLAATLGGFAAAAESGLGWGPATTQYEDLAARAESLAHEGRWSDVVSICETAARKGTLAPGLRERYDLAKLHCDIARRHGEPAFRRQLEVLSEADARRVYAEVLGRISSHHVERPDAHRPCGIPSDQRTRWTLPTAGLW
jgi:hypothetical protein